MREAAQKPTSFQKTSIQFVRSIVHSSELYLISFARPLNVSIQISNLIFEIISARHKLLNMLLQQSHLVFSLEDHWTAPLLLRARSTLTLRIVELPDLRIN